MGAARGRVNFKLRIKRHKKEMERLAQKAEPAKKAEPAAKKPAKAAAK